ncbi:regulatory protein, ArsR [Methanoregula boonei 6A8]|jgi:ArsR family transcriptional regulator|uniref:Regulatory protein, ArsR n=1 Tax=Methanoregula boonei (strain DSM 21154 / JCM 14090 / 6A8) TaxID=456442 RepID=A7I5D1_METB6|nr:metalloregulator ArsR/SmtB family transcription factor [Methanoregula boonei]ABS54942.1 regulatory protein, ArsR [Methanoregula boonei 6A8]
MIKRAGGCSRRTGPGNDRELREIPEPVREELDRLGGPAALKKKIPAQKELDKQSALHHALADPIRLTILYLVRDQPLCVCVIIWYLKISGPKLSYHLNILKECGLIEGVPHGNWIIYSLTGAGRECIR